MESKESKEAKDTERVRLYTVKEAAVIFKVRPGTVRKWARAGIFKTIKVGSPYLIPGSEIDRVARYGINLPGPVG